MMVKAVIPTQGHLSIKLMLPMCSKGSYNSASKLTLKRCMHKTYTESLKTI